MVMSFINFGLVGVEAESCSVSTLRILARSVAEARPTRRMGWWRLKAKGVGDD
jgi:hypothetical protein